MIRTILDSLTLLLTASPFLLSLMVWAVLSIALAKSIKRHSNTYYWVFGVLATIYALPMLLRACGINLPFNVTSLPVIGSIFSEFSSAAYFVHPVIVIIMYMGAFTPKVRYIGRLMSIRKELSIIVGFPVIAHCVKRIINTFPKSWNYFANYEESVANPKVVSEVGSAISNGVLVLGIVMTALFLLLWVTSFDSVRRSMGGKRWKRVQRWSYGLYAMLFIHAVGLQLGGLINTYATENKQKVETVQKTQVDKPVITETKSEVKNDKAKASESKKGRSKRFSIADVEISRKFKAYFNISIYVLVYGSYLFFRLRKARRK